MDQVERVSLWLVISVVGFFWVISEASTQIELDKLRARAALADEDSVEQSSLAVKVRRSSEEIDEIKAIVDELKLRERDNSIGVAVLMERTKPQ